MKKTMIAALVALLMVAFATAMASAGPEHPPFPGDQTTLTEAQKQEMAPLMEKMKDLRLQMFEVEKQMIEKQVSFGNMSQEDADKHIAMMKERAEKGPDMMGHGPDRGPGHGCPGQQPPDAQ